MTDTGLQEVVSTNVRVLMAMQRIEVQKDLAARLGWGESKLTKSLKGDRKWSLEDLPELAEAFGVRPGDLIGDIANLVGAAHPMKTGTSDVTGRVTARYPSGNCARIIPFPLRDGVYAGYRASRRNSTGRVRAARGKRRSFAQPVA